MTSMEVEFIAGLLYQVEIFVAGCSQINSMTTVNVLFIIVLDRLTQLPTILKIATC